MDSELSKKDSTQPTTEAGGTKVEQRLVNRLAREFLAEQRRARRWNIFFKCLLFVYLFGFAGLYFADRSANFSSIGNGKHTALIEVEGVIAPDTEASADHIITGLRRAFEDKNTTGVILRINSPGGSPVQSDYVYNEINRLRGLYLDIPLYAVVTDICASGGYYIASAADEIYANQASLIGSIGVIMESFGFVEALHKLGIERRILYAGKNKAFLDPFSPMKETDVKHIDALLDNIYQQFKTAVIKGRGGRLKESDEVFSGWVWTGEESVEMGLIDGLKSPSEVARELIGSEEIINFSYRKNYLEEFAENFGSVIVNALTERVVIR